ncbi:subtilisin-like protease SBT1.5 [Juglans regia]|uniref:Subtilisin-like protease SBT1.5 n=1 Tax=Juglans regia TaxID=51240 RepID=A0A2I4FWG4_JUGRE|nr:subtilisin-like protease SBT1.5 [Juglans regia]
MAPSLTLFLLFLLSPISTFSASFSSHPSPSPPHRQNTFALATSSRPLPFVTRAELLSAWLPKLAWPPTRSAGTRVAMTLAAFDTAVADRVDFISLSVGVIFLPYYLDAIAIAAFRAYDFGVFVSASAGNGGPGALSVTNISPWVTTVGAGTIDRDFPADVKLGNGKIIPGVSVYGWPALTPRGRGRDEGESPC